MISSYVIPVQADKITSIITAAEVEVDGIWATLLAKALEGKNVKELLSNVGSGGGAPAVGGAPAAAGGGAAAAAPAEEKKEEKKEEKEESDDDMVRLYLPDCLSVTATGILNCFGFIGFRSVRLIACLDHSICLCLSCPPVFPACRQMPHILAFAALVAVERASASRPAAY